ncbi:hypothetical protein [Asticcacaulis sp.]|uniref:hypothetical protein n=1 Tax=Asticcacaulis sp. TaxID=1872648 RepID=UPI0031D2297F
MTSPDAVAESRRLAKELNIPAEVVGQWGAGESPTVGDADAEHIIRQNELNVETKKSSPDDDARKQRIAQTLNVPVDTIDKWAQAGAKADDTLPARRKYTEADFAALTQNEPFFSSGFFGAWLVLSLNLVAITFTLLGFKDWPHNGWKRLAITASGIATAILVSLGLLPSYSGNNGLFIVAALPLASLIFFGTWLTVATVAWIRRGFG